MEDALVFRKGYSFLHVFSTENEYNILYNYLLATRCNICRGDNIEFLLCLIIDGHDIGDIRFYHINTWIFLLIHDEQKYVSYINDIGQQNMNYFYM